MLIRFAVENFLSFKNMTEFSMMAGKITRHSNHIALCNDKRVLKSAFLFGANASGKTNLIRAIDFAHDIITLGLEFTNCSKKYFRIDPDCKDQPGVFQFDIFSGGHFYSYGFAISYSDPSIEEEWLYRLNDDGDFCVFLRSKSENGKSYHFSSDIKFRNEVQQTRFNIYASDISTEKMKQRLFLSDVIMRSPDDEPEYQAFRDVMAWFSRLIVIFPESKYSGITHLLDNNDKKNSLESLLNYFDTGIHAVLKNEVEFDKVFSFLPKNVLDRLKLDLEKQLTEDDQTVLVQQDSLLIEVVKKGDSLLAYEVVSDHGNRSDLFEYGDESDGTRRLFNLIPVYHKIFENCVIIIDELDRSLHTKASLEFINHFYHMAENTSAQLIITTHDSNIMDLDFVRQDEIWFIERQDDHSSNLYSLNKFKARFDTKVGKHYLLGRYGSIPIFRQMSLDSSLAEDGEEDGRQSQ